MTRKRSLLMLFIILGLSIILLSQCTKSVIETDKSTKGNVIAGVGKGKDTTSVKQSQTLKVAVSMQPTEYALLQKQSAEYVLSHNDIHIELNNVIDGYAELKKANQLGDGPDLMLLDNHWVNEFAALGFLHPMDEFFTGEQQSQGITTLMNQVKWNGYLWAIPKDVDPYILVWNTRIPTENKLPQHPPETVDEWLAWNKALMHPEAGKYGIYFDPSDTYAFLSLISTITDDMTHSSFLTKMNDPIIIKKLEKFFAPQEEIWNGSSVKQNYPPLSTVLDPWYLLKQGKIAAMVSTVSEYKQNGNSDISFAALSLKNNISYETINYGLLKGRSYAISSRSKNSALAINWIKQMTSIGTDLTVWDKFNLLPSLPTAYLTTPISNDTNSNSYLRLINNGKVLPVEPGTNKKIMSIKNEWFQVWQGKQSMKTFIENSSRLWKETKSNF